MTREWYKISAGYARAIGDAVVIVRQLPRLPMLWQWIVMRDGQAVRQGEDFERAGAALAAMCAARAVAAP